jgi:hypothetical protein
MNSPALTLLLLVAAGPALGQAASPGDWKLAITDTATAVAADLNRDGFPDRLLRRECGNSNCAFRIVDGATSQQVGEVEGSIIFVRARRLNQWPVVQTWVHMSAGSGLYSTWVYDGRQYVSLAQVPVEGEGLERLFQDLDKVPAGTP